MGGNLSCAGRGHTHGEGDEDGAAYGFPLPAAPTSKPGLNLSMPNGVVAPSEKYVVTSGEPELGSNNNIRDDSAHGKLGPHRDDSAHGKLGPQRRPSWRFWKRMSARRHTKNKSRTLDKLSTLTETTRVTSEGLPDVVDTSTTFGRSLSLNRKAPPKPPRLFLFRSSSINTPRSSVVGATDRNSFIQSQAYQNGAKNVSITKQTTIIDATNVPPTNKTETSTTDITNNSQAGNNLMSKPVVPPHANMVSRDVTNVTIAVKSNTLPAQRTYVVPAENPAGDRVSDSVVIRRTPTRSPTGKIKIVSPELSRKSNTRIRKRPSEITVNDCHILIMQSAQELICQKLDPFVLLDDLSKHSILNKEDMTAFSGHPDRRLICDNIIQAIIDRDYSSFLSFCDVLRGITDYVTVAAVLDAMNAIYEVIYERRKDSGNAPASLNDDNTVTFDVVYYSLETGKIRSVVELEKSRNQDKRFSRDILSYKRGSRLSFHSITSETSSIFGEDLINTGIPMVTVAIAGHDMGGDRAKRLSYVIAQHSCILELHIGKTNLKGCDMGPILNSLQYTSGLRVLDLRLNSIGNEGAAFIANTLRQNRILTQLNISSTGIDAEGCKLLADSLLSNTCLSDLDMSFVDIEDCGCLAIGDVLKQNRSLKKLRLRSCNISWIGCGFLLEGISVGKAVTELDLSRNFIGDDGAGIIGRHLDDNSSLRSLNLENCGFTSVGCAMLSDVILTNKSLTQLDLSVNFIGDQGILKLSNALGRNRTIRTLGLNMCGITNDGFSKLLDVLEINPSIHLLKLCYNRLGREHTNPEATSDGLKYRIRIVTSSNPKLKLLLWGNTFEESYPLSQMTRDVTAVV